MPVWQRILQVCSKNDARSIREVALPLLLRRHVWSRVCLLGRIKAYLYWSEASKGTVVTTSWWHGLGKEKLRELGPCSLERVDLVNLNENMMGGR